MSGYRGHLRGGAIAYSLLLLLVLPYYTPTPVLALEWFVIALFGSLFPDIDIKSKGQNIFYLLCACAFLSFYVCKMHDACMGLAACAVFPPLCSHRGITHSLWFLLLLCVGAGWFLSALLPAMQHLIQLNFLFFFVGVLSHLYLDFGIKRMVRW